VPPRRAVRRVARSAKRTRVRLETDERRAQLLALAKKSFSNRSYDDVSIDDLAREAKISKGLLYHYFPTKRDLYVAGLSEIADELVAVITNVPVDLAPIDRVRRSLDGYLGYITQQAKGFVSLMRGGIGSDPQVAAVIENVRQRLFDGFLGDSPFKPMLAGDPKFETAVRGWIGFVEHASLDWAAKPRLARDELRELLTQVLIEIMRVTAPVMFR
jgi:AcrR family transcriptional regulator